ncbi:hypothetical protein MBLNU230_g7110t1 [Neophaeotheca triangularis]
MPRPHFTQHLSLRRLKSSVTSNSNGESAPPSSGANSENVSRNASPSRSGALDGKGDHKGMGLVLKLDVLKGRDLAAKDKSGTSDPYLVFTLGEEKEATPVISKTLSPEWNETFEFPILTAESALLEAVCWDKDRFKKDYMGEFDVLLEGVFASGNVSPEPQWYPLESRRSGRRRKKDVIVTGEVLLKFTLVDPVNPAATPEQIMQKFSGLVEVESSADDEDEDDEDDEELLARMESRDLDDLDEEEDDKDPSDETDDAKASPNAKEEGKQHRKRRRRLRRLKRRSKLKAYEFSGTSDVAGVLFLEINRITDLPPEKNMTRTSFDMDPFVVTSLGRKTYRTRVIKHDLNPVFDEKLVFQVQKHQLKFMLNFAVVDRDKLSGNDFVGTCNLPVSKVTEVAPQPDPMTGLFELASPPDPTEDGSADVQRKRRFRMPLSRSGSQTNVGRSSRNSSSSNLTKMNRTTSSNSVQRSSRPSFKQEEASGSAIEEDDQLAPTSNPELNASTTSLNVAEPPTAGEDPELNAYEMPLELKNKQRWDNKCNPVVYIKAKYLPYQALRQQFWRAMLRQYDADESGKMNKVELTTMLDSLGSTLHAKTIDGFFKHWKNDNGGHEYLTMDQAVISLEDQLMKTIGQHKPGWSPAGLKARMDPRTKTSRLESARHGSPEDSSGANSPYLEGRDGLPSNTKGSAPVPALAVSDLSKGGEEGDILPENDLTAEDSAATDEEDDLEEEEDSDTREEHVVEIQECPICHQPRLARRKRTNDADIITHIATCASSDWRSVNNIVMAGFVTSSQAQRKWYSKIITKVSYGGYKLGANSANILVQDRMTGMINEERMSVYVRLGIRLLYKGMKSREMERKKTKRLLRSLSFKQGRKYDDPNSASQIPGFINFHQLDMSEVLRPTSEFKNFNEFFFRQLKPDARPCSAPDNPRIIVSPADCRSVVFDELDHAQQIWVKGREFSVERLLGNAYPEDAARYKNGGLGIFRLAPQDYHRFHIPVDGIMDEPKLIDGEYYTVNPMAIRSALDVYGENIRVIVPIDSEAHGRVMVICVGAMMVGSTVITRKKGEHVKRAEELGYFKFGGSTILLLFEPGRMVFDDDLVHNSDEALETLVRVGMSIGHSPNQAQHAPDQKKKNPTENEKQEAKRRIEGSLAPSQGMPSMKEAS